MKNMIQMMSKIKVGGGTLLTSILAISILGILFFLILNRNKKMKYLKKLTSVALVLTMLLLPFSNLLNVKAEGTTIDVDNSNKVTNMTNLVVYSTDQYTAYKVLDAYYDKNTNEMSYKFTSAFQEFLSSSTDDNIKNLTIDEYISYGYDSNDSTLTTDEKAEKDKSVRKLADSFARYIRSNDKTFQTYDLINTDGNVSGQVEVGSYLVLPKSINQYINSGFPAIRSYTATIVNAVFRANDGNWYLDENNYLNIKGSNIYAMTSFVNDTPEKALQALMTDDFEPSVDMSFKANSIYTYFFSALNIINDSTITITLPDGLKFVPGEVKYASYLSDKDNYKLSEIKDKIIDESTGKEYATATVSEKRIIIKTTASALVEEFAPYLFVGVTLDDNSENIVLGESGNIIKADYDVVVDPYTPEPTKKTLSFENKVTTYGLQITNTEINNSNTLLSNAIFGIYTDEACSDENLVGTLTTDSNGIAKFKGIINETYYIKQIKAATGYKLNTNPVKITVDTASLNSENYFPLEATNTKMGLLPSTGGLGTIFYTLIGLVVVGIGAYEVVKYSKRQVNN